MPLLLVAAMPLRKVVLSFEVVLVEPGEAPADPPMVPARALPVAIAGPEADPPGTPGMVLRNPDGPDAPARMIAKFSCTLKLLGIGRTGCPIAVPCVRCKSSLVGSRGCAYSLQRVKCVINA